MTTVNRVNYKVNIVLKYESDIFAQSIIFIQLVLVNGWCCGLQLEQIFLLLLLGLEKFFVDIR